MGFFHIMNLINCILKACRVTVCRFKAVKISKANYSVQQLLLSNSNSFAVYVCVELILYTFVRRTICISNYFYFQQNSQK